ncbi:MAG: T9SS type A sorting domain-containing protein [Flavobacteriales bacterium]|nr:T9SS type A sorting domain-containing protein [Flavobacteriales bacterium]
MTRRIKQIVLILFLTITGNAEAQIWQKHSKSGNSGLGDVVFINKSTGFILGYTKIFRTDDTGKTWTQILSSYTKFSRMKFFDENFGIVIGENDLILKTLNAGKTWTSLKSGNSDDDFLALHAVNKDTFYVLGPDDISTNKFGNYLNYTYDGGSTWGRQTTGSSSTIRSVHMWNKNRGLMGTLSAGIFVSSNAFKSYNVNWGANNCIEMRVIQDSVVICVGLNGKIFRSRDYGSTFTQITSGTTQNLWGCHFANDSIGMACGELGTIVYTKDGGLTWAVMNTNTTLPFRRVYVVNEYYAWAVAYSTNGDSTDIFKFGSEKYISENINRVKGKVVADIKQNCKRDAGEIGPSGVLIEARPGPYYTYTINGGEYDLVIPDTGTYTVNALLPDKFGGSKNLCDTQLNHKVVFKTLDNSVGGKNFYYKADSGINLEIKISSSRKRRCSKNTNTITYKNTGFGRIDSTIIQLFYSPYTQIVKADQPYTQSNNGSVKFKTGPLNPGEGGVIQVLDSVLCNNPNIRGLYACMRVIITPFIKIEKNDWDGSVVTTELDCYKDSFVVVKIKNDGNKQMGDSSEVNILLDELLVDNLKVKLSPQDSMKFILTPGGKTVFVETVIPTQHPYLEHIRVFEEGCGDSAGIVSKNQIEKYPLQEYPSFEDQICLQIRDSYDPNDIAVVPAGYTSEHFIRNDQKLKYTIRFQNTGTDTAYHIYIVDSIPEHIDLSNLQITGSSHPYRYKVTSTNNGAELRFYFDNIYLVDSFTNEPLSNGYIVYEVTLKDSIKKGSRVENKADIYFDFNPPVRTNTVFNTIGDTVLKSPAFGTVQPCLSKFISTPNDTVVCDAFYYETALKKEGIGKLNWKVDDILTVLKPLNDSVASVQTQHDGRFEITMSLQNCENTWYDTAIVYFWQNPRIQVKDSLYCGKVEDNIYFSCFACSYLWNDSIDSYNFKPDKPGTYWVKATNLCKSISDTFTLSYLPYVSLDLGKDTLLCDKQTLLLSSDLTEGRFLWNDADTSSYKLIDKRGTYTLQFTNACNDVADTIVVNQKRSPGIDLGRDTVYCYTVDRVVDLDSIKDEFYIQWNDGNTFAKRQLKDTGLFSVKLSNACGMAEDSILLGVLQIPEINLGRDSIYCSDFNRVIQLNPGVRSFSVEWFDSDTLLSKTLDREGVYFAKVFNRCGSVTDTLKLLRMDPPVIDLGKDTTYCNDFSRVLNAYFKDCRYIWNTGDTVSEIIVTQPGAYWAKAKNYCGEYTSNLILKRENKPIVDLGMDTTLKEVNNFILDAANPGSKYLWSTGDTSKQINVNDHGLFWVRVSNYCGDVSDSILLIAPPVIYPDTSFILYPNPVLEGDLYVRNFDADFSIEIIDQTGRVVLKKSFQRGLHRVNLSSLSAGIYFLRLMEEEKQKRFIRLLVR